MSVRRLETAEEIARLLAVKDDVEQHKPGTHSEWVQWLVSQAENPKVAIWANFEEDSIDSYIVVFDMVNPPLSNHLHITYVSSLLRLEKNLDVLQEIKEWAGLLGAKKITATTKTAKAFEKYGFVKTAEVIELRIK